MRRSEGLEEVVGRDGTIGQESSLPMWIDFQSHMYVMCTDVSIHGCVCLNMAEVICTPNLFVLICHNTFMRTSLVFCLCGL